MKIARTPLLAVIQRKGNSLALFMERQMVPGILESNLTTSITIKKLKF